MIKTNKAIYLTNEIIRCVINIINFKLPKGSRACLTEQVLVADPVFTFLVTTAKKAARSNFINLFLTRAIPYNLNG